MLLDSGYTYMVNITSCAIVDSVVAYGTILPICSHNKATENQTIPVFVQLFWNSKQWWTEHLSTNIVRETAGNLDMTLTLLYHTEWWHI